MFKCLALAFVFVALTDSRLRGWNKHIRMSRNIEERLHNIDEEMNELKDILETIVDKLNENQEDNRSGFLMAGEITNQTYKAAGFYNPYTNFYCDLPPLSPRRDGPTLTGVVACGGWTSSVSNSCSTFNTATGNWTESYEIIPPREGHSAWQNSQGILLMGGSSSGPNSIYNSTTLLLPEGGSRPGFDLVSPTYFSCAIPDPRSDSIIVLGGYGYGGGSVPTVTRYGESGFSEFLPSLNHSRIAPGCAGYYNNNNQLVMLVFGINKPTETFTVGSSLRWEDLPDDATTSGYYSFAATVNNEIFMQDSHSPFIQKWDKTGRTWEDVVNIGYTRYGYNNIGSAVPLSSGIEKFCLTEDQRKKYFSTTEDEPREDMPFADGME